MTLIRWKPRPTGRELTPFHTELDRFFDDLVGRSPLATDFVSSFVPPIDLEESADGFVLRADLPGMSHQDVSVHLSGDTVVVRGERKAGTPSKDATTHRSERIHGTFERSFTLGTRVRGDQVEASFKDGVLEIRIPKADESRVREIEIKAG
jgi:HSP20 family protein